MLAYFICLCCYSPCLPVPVIFLPVRLTVRLTARLTVRLTARLTVRLCCPLPADQCQDRLDFLLFTLVVGGSLILEGKTTSSEKDILYSIKAPAHGQWKLQIPRQSTEPYITVKGSSHENINFDFDFQIEVKVGIRRKKVISQSAIEGITFASSFMQGLRQDGYGGRATHSRVYPNVWLI